MYFILILLTMDMYGESDGHKSSIEVLAIFYALPLLLYMFNTFMWPYMEGGVINMLTKLLDYTSNEVIKTDEYLQDALAAAASNEELEKSNTSNT